MSKHASWDEVVRAQVDGRVSMLYALAMRCRSRFIRSADLVCMSGPAIDSLRRFGQLESVDVSPLFVAWGVLCDRYLAERYDGQISLLPATVPDEPVRWSRFVNHELFPTLVRDDEFVRNVLRALGALPCASPTHAAAAVGSYFLNMTLPHDPPPWAPEEDIEL